MCGGFGESDFGGGGSHMHSAARLTKATRHVSASRRDNLLRICRGKSLIVSVYLGEHHSVMLLRRAYQLNLIQGGPVDCGQLVDFDVEFPAFCGTIKLK